MTSRLKKNAPLLKMMSKAKPPVVKAILKTCDRDLIATLCDIALNVLKSHVSLTPSQKRRLSRHKHTLRQLVKKQVSLKKKKALLQKGGFLGALLKPVLGILGGILGV